MSPLAVALSKALSAIPIPELIAIITEFATPFVGSVTENTPNRNAHLVKSGRGMAITADGKWLAVCDADAASGFVGIRVSNGRSCCLSLIRLWLTFVAKCRMCVLWYVLI